MISQIKLNNGLKTTDPQVIQKEIESWIVKNENMRQCATPAIGSSTKFS